MNSLDRVSGWKILRKADYFSFMFGDHQYSFLKPFFIYVSVRILNE